MVQESIVKMGVEVRPEGPLDSKGADKLRHILLHHIRSGQTHIVLDVDAVSYVNSDGLRMLLGLLNEEPGIRIDITNASPQVVRTFALTRLDRVFNIAGRSNRRSIGAA